MHLLPCKQTPGTHSTHLTAVAGSLHPITVTLFRQDYTCVMLLSMRQVHVAFRAHRVWTKMMGASTPSKNQLLSR